MRIVVWTALVIALGMAMHHGDSLLASANELPANELPTLVFDRAELKLNGSDARGQLMVSVANSDGAIRDLTREVQFRVEPSGILSIDASGLMTPISSGAAAVTAHLDGFQDASTTVSVEINQTEQVVNFPNQVVPIFTKYGCNGGGCHGKIAGQNGFRLSLLGSEPLEDFEHLVRESRGRRLFPASPDASLLLQKSLGTVPHGGGQRMEMDTHEYRVLRRWISQNMPLGDENARRVVAIEVTPQVRQMVRNSEQQLAVIARYTDGSTDDITRTAQYESNNLEMADVSMNGLVKVRDLAGEVSVMARYQGQVTVFRASIPLGTKIETWPPSTGVIDEAVFAKLRSLGIPPSAVCDDNTFLRRATLDIAGRLPTLRETDEFLSNTSENKRAILVDRLLAGPDYASNFANKWSAILRNNHSSEETRFGAYAFHEWMRESFQNNKPMDLFVRELLTASGSVDVNPAVVWFRQVNNIESRIEDVAQLFLGQRLQCARCHHHPYEKWAQQDYYQMAAFFATVDRKEGTLQQEPRFVSRVGQAATRNTKTGKDVRATGLDAPPAALSDSDDPREALADWMSSKDNPFFAKSLANRYWKHFLGRGLVEPEDDMRVSNPPSNPELLDTLAKMLIETGFDSKQLIRAICNSTTYQLSSDANSENLRDTNCFSRYYPKRLNAEILLDSLDEICGTVTRFDGMPVGTRAIQLPDTSFSSYFLTVFGRPDSATACECERATSSTLAQSLHLMNSKEIQSKLHDANGRSAIWSKTTTVAEGLTPAEQIRKHATGAIHELYRRAFSRSPSESELTVAIEYLMTRSERLQEAFEDLTWSVVNSKEFLFNH